MHWFLQNARHGDLSIVSLFRKWFGTNISQNCFKNGDEITKIGLSQHVFVTKSLSNAIAKKNRSKVLTIVTAYVYMLYTEN